jgi:glycosyltransferase involved in cell wall biosynthesis
MNRGQILVTDGLNSMPDASPPRLSVLVCTYNGAQLLRACLDSILRQTLQEFEVLCIDGMSQDDTQNLIQEYAARDSRVRLVINENRLPEGQGNGKWLGARAARGEFLAVIDQDNVLQRPDLFAAALTLLGQDTHLVGVLGGLTHDLHDSRVVRFVSLFGTDAFFAYRSVDFLRSVGSNVREGSIAGVACELIPMSLDNLPLTGGNCFFYRKGEVEQASGYDQDVLVVQRLVGGGRTETAVLPHATKHYAEASLRRLAAKKFFWGRKYFNAGAGRFNYWPTTARERIAFTMNLLFNLSVLPNLYHSWRAFRRSGDWVAWLFPVFALLNTVAYGGNCLVSKLTTHPAGHDSRNQPVR